MEVAAELAAREAAGPVEGSLLSTEAITPKREAVWNSRTPVDKAIEERRGRPLFHRVLWTVPAGATGLKGARRGSNAASENVGRAVGSARAELGVEGLHLEVSGERASVGSFRKGLR